MWGISGLLERRSRRPSRAPQSNLVTTAIQSSRVAFKRYLVYSCSLASIAVGFAIIISFMAVNYTTEASAPKPDPVVTANVSMSPPIAFEVTLESAFLEALHRADETGNDLILTTPSPTPPLLAPTATAALTGPEATPIAAPASSSNRASTAPAASGLIRTAPVTVLKVVPGRGVALPPSSVTVTGAIRDVNITFYDCADQGFCGEMYNGELVYEGAAACSWNLPIGTAFFIVGDPTGRIYTCKDRGLLSDTWVDIFWHHPADGYAWQAAVGRYGTIAIVSPP